MEKGAYYHLQNQSDEEESRLAGLPDMKPRVISSRAPADVVTAKSPKACVHTIFVLSVL